MFNFKDKVLKPAMSGVIARFNGALAAPTTGEKVEQLLALKEESDKQLSALERREENKAGALYVAGALILSVALACLTTFTAGVLATPLINIGIAAGIGGIWAGFRKQGDWNLAGYGKETIGERIDAEVKRLSTAEPAEAVKSARYAKIVSDDFNKAAEVNKKFKELSQRVAPKNSGGAPAP